jgi:hypothetical protein
MEYNTTRQHLSIPEYGRLVHKMIEYTMTIEDREKRNRAARQIVMVMGQLTNAQREGGDYKQKLWDHLFMISGYQLDIDSPFPKPEPPAEEKKPIKPSYPHSHINYKQYGKSVELMIEKTIEYEEGPEKETLTRYIANHLKKMYLNWNRESVQDDLIGKHLSMMSGGKLQLSEDTRLEAAVELLPRINNNTGKKKKYGGQGGKQNNQKNYGNYNRKKQRKQQGQ